MENQQLVAALAHLTPDQLNSISHEVLQKIISKGNTDAVHDSHSSAHGKNSVFMDKHSLGNVAKVTPKDLGSPIHK